MNSVINRVRRFRSTNLFAAKLISPTLKHPTKVMVWGCFSRNGLGGISVLDGYMNSTKYIEVLNEKLIPTIQEKQLSNPVHLDDSAPCHRTKQVKEWHRLNNINQVDWPGNSPDLNPIENIWGYMKSKIRRRVIKNKTSLLENILHIWREEIPISMIQKLSDSMPSRLDKVIKNKGGITKY